ncbi:hypothetical protein HBZC1_p0090 (plasmid) [Helicobacter bizzozeronii CIII-1]|uniref:Uncharacterized protein n=1 Tax=Helicobacter bizzozeronii (strain CIII-1) TaxID=1002804 RepID=F8KUF4_HELBC|nr:hypothetical protein HBZC1_p0090 [Helicobacter bizzozeronii CIII-1]
MRLESVGECVEQTKVTECFSVSYNQQLAGLVVFGFDTT